MCSCTNDFRNFQEPAMLKTSLLISALALAAILGVPNVLAADAASKLEAKFKKADKDNDGTLDREEAKAMPRVAKHFDILDTDKDGTVSLDEIKAGMQG